jgi:hypothetical protein
MDQVVVSVHTDHGKSRTLPPRLLFSRFLQTQCQIGSNQAPGIDEMDEGALSGAPLKRHFG